MLIKSIVYSQVDSPVISIWIENIFKCEFNENKVIMHHQDNLEISYDIELPFLICCSFD